MLPVELGLQARPSSGGAAAAGSGRGERARERARLRVGENARLREGQKNGKKIKKNHIRS